MEIRARAPGKIILSGEHAVAHGATTVAASVNLYTYVSIRLSNASDTDDGFLQLQLKDMGLAFSWSLQRIKETVPDFGTVLSPSSASLSRESMKSIATLVAEQNIPEAEVGLFSGISAFLWLYTSIQGYTIGIFYALNFPAFCLSFIHFIFSISFYLLIFHFYSFKPAKSGALRLDTKNHGWSALGEMELELVNKWAFEGEKIIHGKPSGIDNTVSTFGNMIMFRLGELTHIKTTSMPLKMLITNTKVGRNTKVLVAGVSERSCRHPDAMASVFTTVDSISKELATIIQSPASDELSIKENEDKLEELMEMNQGLLQSMGVSHSSIETVLRTTLKFKLASKLTGAGGGGCVLTLLPAFLADAVVDKVIAELEPCGFQCLIAAIGGKGLEICSFNGS